MTLEEMKMMELNSFREIPLYNFRVLRVPNGWIYYSQNWEGTFVPELTIIQEHIVKRETQCPQK